MGGNVHVVRLRPGDDLREALESLTRRERWPAACVVAAVGSLTRAAIRFADREAAVVVNGPLEIVGLTGTLAADGGPHLHVTVADARGATSGGHLVAGCEVRTTAEIAILVLAGWRFSRPLDPETGFRELVATREGASGGGSD